MGRHAVPPPQFDFYTYLVRDVEGIVKYHGTNENAARAALPRPPSVAYSCTQYGVTSSEIAGVHYMPALGGSQALSSGGQEFRHMIDPSKTLRISSRTLKRDIELIIREQTRSGRDAASGND